MAVLRTASKSAIVETQPQALAMWRAQPGALMLLGRAPGPVPKAGSVRMAAMPGVFRAEFWPLADESGYGFLAACRLPPAADRMDGAKLTLRGARGVDRDFSLTVAGSSSEADFGQQAALLAKPYAARLTRFMLDVMRSDDGGDTHQPRLVLGAFLAHAARPDGCVELIMHVPQQCVVLQGWGTLHAEAVELLLPTAGTARHTASCGDFTRSDLVAPSTGSIIAVSPDLVDVMAGLETVYLLADDDLVSRHVVEKRVLGTEASIGQIRHLLPEANCPAPLQALLRAALQPRYDGSDTLNIAGRPVRAAVDMAVAANGEGAYISGWVFDPAARTNKLHLCAEGLELRLDESWVRVPRPDVGSAFAADPAFPTPRHHDWGFSVAIPRAPTSDQPAWFRFTFADDDQAFVPIRFVPPDTPAVLDVLFASVDLHKPSGLPIIERHLAPFVAGLPATSAAQGQILLRGPLDRPRAIVVPLRAARLPRSFVSSFLLDPALADEQITFICGPNWDHAQLENLIGLIRFYALPASVVGLLEAPLPASAIGVAAALSQAESFLLASPGVVGQARGWREAIHHATPAASVVYPTVLFEDRSLRFAGSQHVTFIDRAPFAEMSAPLAGASADVVGEGEPIVVETGTLACCLMQRAALPALSQAARFRTQAGQEAAFFFSLREAGLHGVWAPSIRVSAPEEDAAEVMPVVQLLDGWILRQTWGEASACAF